MSARRNCAGTLVEVNLGFQSKIPSKQPNFTPTCDSCDCAFPVVGLLLVSVYLWQLEPSLSRYLRLSLCLTLCLCMSLSLFICLLFPSLWMANWPAAPISSPCLTPLPHPNNSLGDRVCFMFLPAEKTLRCIAVLEISGLNFQWSLIIRQHGVNMRSHPPCAFVLRDINTDSQTATCTRACMRQAQVGSFIREYKPNFSPCSPHFTLSVTPSLPLYALFFSSFSAF